MGVRVFVCLALGVGAALALGPAHGPPAWFAVVACVLLGALGVALRAKAGWIALACAAASLGYTAAAVRTFEHPAQSVGRLLGEHITILAVEGVALDAPRTDPPARGQLAEFARDAPATRFTFRVRRVRVDDAWVRASGDLWIRVDGVMMGVRPGDSLRLSGQAFGVEAPTNPGQRDFRPRAHERDLAGRLLVPSIGLVERVDQGDWRARRIELQGALRDRASAWLDSLNASDGARALLAAAVFGQTEGEYSRVRRSFARTGLAHLLAISGIHLVLLAWFTLLAARALLPGRRSEAMVVAIAVLVYMAIVPANPPVVRAGVMTLGFLAAEAFGRRYDPINVLAWTACLIVLLRPTDLTSVGFHLSFLAVGGLIAFTPTVSEMLSRRGALAIDEAPRGVRAARRRARTALAASLSAWAITAPLVAYHVGLFTPLAPLAALLVAPVFSALLGAGYLTTLVSAVSPTLARPLVALTGEMAEVFLAVVRLLERLPGSAMNTPPVAWWWAVLATVAVAMLLRRGVRTPGALAALFVIVGVVVVDGARSGRLDERVALRIDTLDVGDGACHLVRSGGDAVLWDCGSTWVGIGERDIPDALRALGAWRVRTLIISHPNLDHYSGALDAAARLGVREVLTTDAFLEEAARDPLGPVAFTVDRLRDAGVDVRAIGAGHVIDLGNARVEFLWPPDTFASERANDESLVARVDATTAAGVRTLLLTGDIEPAGIDAMLASTGPLRAHIVEAPHHGSARPGAIGFVASLHPDVVIQSTGPQRLDDERWDAVKAGTRWWTTAADGAVYAEVLRTGEVRSGRLTPR